MYHLAKKEETPYITMEYVPGEDLKSLVKRKEKLANEEAISIAKQVCEGLVEAHELGVVHRDLKPQNIMIDKKGRAKIMDFGISRSLETKGVTEAGVIIGTPEYMSPEQVEGKEVGKRSDIYSVGVILYEMVTGRIPFEGDAALSIALKHKSEMPQEPRQINAKIPKNLSRVILKCMEKDKEKRYEGADDLLSELVKIEQAISTAERVVPRRIPLNAKEVIKPNHSTRFYKSKKLLGILLTKEITVEFKVKKLFIQVLVIIALAVIVRIVLRLMFRFN
jgi:serine/threonine protein kinase